nr:carbohydrate-binding family 9-like protein [uncultured Desulfobacter sp.]
MQHYVFRQDQLRVDASLWQKTPWNEIASQKLTCHMGASPLHFPDTRVKVAYDDHAIYLMFRVQDRYVRALARTDQDRVYQDSCVEFFFTPGLDPEQGYFNLEMNCGGTILFHFQTLPRQNPVQIPLSDCARIIRDASLPKVVNPEIQEPVLWFLSVSIPFDLLSLYTDVIHPEQGNTWRANFYKCADNTSHPHWLTWAPVDLPAPDFHQPKAFGHLCFL